MKRSQANIFLWLLVILLANLWVFSFFNHAFDDDEFQHAHVAWLLHHGYTPYKDFFEHHLVFYHRLMAPLFNLGENFRQIFLFRGISLISAAGTLILLYRLGRSFGISPLASGTGIWLIGIVPMFLLKMTEARPESLAILAFSGALSLMFAKSGKFKQSLTGYNTRNEKIDSKEQPKGWTPNFGVQALACLRKLVSFHPNPFWQFILIGLLTGVMSLLSQKYVIIAGTLLITIYFLHGWKQSLISITSFLISIAIYAGWMLASSCGKEAFESVILLNLRWKYTFPPSGYLVELFTTGGVLFVCGTFGIVMNVFQGHLRRQAFAFAVLLAGSILQIYLVPVPYRQSFLPMLVILAIGTMFFFSSMYRISRTARSGWVALIVPLLLGASSLTALPGQLKADNRSDISQMKEIAKLAPSGPVFDGRGLMFFRMHVGYYACMHHEILLMIDPDKYAENVIRSLQSDGLPPVIRDYRVQKMPEYINIFISNHYLQSMIPGVLSAGFLKERLVPKKPEVMNIMAGGNWKATWRGGNITVDGIPIVNGQIFILERGAHIFVSDNLSWDFRLERSY